MSLADVPASTCTLEDIYPKGINHFVRNDTEMVVRESDHRSDAEMFVLCHFDQMTT